MHYLKLKKTHQWTRFSANKKTKKTKHVTLSLGGGGGGGEGGRGALEFNSKK